MIKQLSKSIIFVAIAVLVGVTVVYAGSLTPPGAPSVTMYTLDDIYTKLINNTNASSHSLSTTTSPAGTFHTLTQIYGAVPTIDPTQVLSGITYLGVAGSALVSAGNAGAGDVLATKTFSTSTAANISGSMPNNGAMTFTPSTTTQTISAGYHNGSGIVSGDTDLVAGNIKKDINIFNVVGTLIGALGNAGVGDVLNTVTFSSSTAANITGGISVATGDTVVASSSAQGTSLVLAVPQAYYSGANSVTVSTSSANFISANIAQNVNIFGVTGSLAAGFTYGAAPLKTGQTLCYATSTAGAGHACAGGTDTGQDGALQKGVARSYSTSTSITTDNVTGLVWQTCTAGLTGPACAGGAVALKTWVDALNYCNTNPDGLPDPQGTGWRLPNINELLSLVDYGKVSGATINTTYFPNTQANSVWSATTYQFTGNESYAWIVYFNVGYADSNGKTVSYRVRCVRG